MINAAIAITLFILIILSVNFSWAEKALDGYFTRWLPKEDAFYKAIFIIVAALLAAGIIWQTFLA